MLTAILRHRSGLSCRVASFQFAVRVPTLGWFAVYRAPATIRTQILTCGAILGRAGRRLVTHLSVSWGGLKIRIPLIDSILNWEIQFCRSCSGLSKPDPNRKATPLKTKGSEINRRSIRNSGLGITRRLDQYFVRWIEIRYGHRLGLGQLMKFVVPMVAKVYIPNYDNAVNVYGPLGR